MSFKDRLREKRLEANLTQVQLAEKVSVSARTIQNYESGTRKPTKYDVVEKIAASIFLGKVECLLSRRMRRAAQKQPEILMSLSVK